MTIQQLPAARGLTTETIHNIVHEDLGLSKKICTLGAKLLNTAPKERMHICAKFMDAISRDSEGLKSRIVTMDKTMVTILTPESKKQSKRQTP